MGKYYYDGIVKDSGRTLEEIEADIEKEKERMKKVNEWEDPVIKNTTNQ